MFVLGVPVAQSRDEGENVAARPLQGLRREVGVQLPPQASEQMPAAAAQQIVEGGDVRRAFVAEDRLADEIQAVREHSLDVAVHQRSGLEIPDPIRSRKIADWVVVGFWRRAGACAVRERARPFRLGPDVQHLAQERGDAQRVCAGKRHEDFVIDLRQTPLVTGGFALFVDGEGRPQKSGHRAEAGVHGSLFEPAAEDLVEPEPVRGRERLEDALQDRQHVVDAGRVLDRGDDAHGLILRRRVRGDVHGTQQSSHGFRVLARQSGQALERQVPRVSHGAVRRLVSQGQAAEETAFGQDGQPRRVGCFREEKLIVGRALPQQLEALFPRRGVAHRPGGVAQEKEVVSKAHGVKLKSSLLMVPMSGRRLRFGILKPGCLSGTPDTSESTCNSP